MKHLIRLIALTSLLAIFLPPAFAADAKPAAADKAAKDEKPVPEARTWVTQHKVRIGGTTVAYTATAGTMLMKNDEDEPVALFGFTSYVKDDGDPRTRPLVFAYNGGPGSASVWLHMGILGPKRTDLKDLDYNTRGPFRTVENEFSILDKADLVMIDPVGTGFARPVGKGEGKDFWGVDQDIESVSKFIVQYLDENNRWAAPKFILGESYGGVRTAGVTYKLLKKYNVALNGIILVSPYLDLNSHHARMKIDLPYVNFLSTYAATAWYHHALANRPAELQPFLREVEAFAENVYAPALYKGSRASAEERQAVLAGLERYTGVSADYWDKANLRMTEGQFLQELMRNRRQVVGRIDSRYVGDDLNALAESMNYDSYDAAIGPAIAATFNDYYRGELGVRFDRRYLMSAREAPDWAWDERHQQPNLGGKAPFPNTVVDLSQAMTLNPKMKVLVDSGYFDMACPYRTIEYAIDHLDIAPELRRNVTIEYYRAGHMMYVEPESMKKFKDTLAAFVEANSH